MDSEAAILCKLYRLSKLPMSKKYLQKTTYKLKISPSVTLNIDSFKYPENSYRMYFDKLPCPARGLFAIETPIPRVLVRGYDKFFNLDEVENTKEVTMKTNTKPPYEVTIKENGCIIFVSAFQNTLIVTSKHSMNTANEDALENFHASKGSEWLDIHLRNAEKSRDDLVSFLQINNVTAVFELADDDFEEHILAYSAEKRGLYLHGINENSVLFKTWNSEKVQQVATMFGFFAVDFLTISSFDDVMNFVETCRKTGSYNDRFIEGFVIRCKTSDGDNFFFKAKFEEPYLMFREWREITNSLLSNGKYSLKPRYKLSEQYVKWTKDKIKTDPSVFQEFLNKKGIIKARELFLEENNLSDGWKMLVNESLRVNDASNSIASSLVISETSKILLLPIAIPGVGKTTLAKLLCKFFKFAHIQSDNFKKKGFLKAVINAFKNMNIVFADKCNHLTMHRTELISLFRDSYPNGRVLVIQWDISSLSRAEILKAVSTRIQHRGEEHAKLTPQKTPEWYTIVSKFIKEFAAFDINEDVIVDAFITVGVNEEFGTKFKKVCSSLGLDLSESDIYHIDTITGTLPLSNTIEAETTFSKHEKVRRNLIKYYGLYISFADIFQVIANKLKQMEDESMQGMLYSIHLSSCFIDSGLLNAHKEVGFHVTLAHYENEQLMLKYNEFILQETMESYALSASSGLEILKSEITINSIIWNDEILVASVKIPEKYPCQNEFPHITIAKSESKKATESNIILKNWFSGKRAGLNGMDIGIKVDAFLSEFLI